MTPGATEKRASRRRTARRYFSRRTSLTSHLSKCYWCGAKLVWMRMIPLGYRVHFNAPKFRLTFQERDGGILTLRIASLDHVTPLSEGGSERLSNIVPACVPCNKDRAARKIVFYVCQRCGRPRRGRKPHCRSCRKQHAQEALVESMRYSVSVGRSQETSKETVRLWCI